jgi:adenosine kinase
MSQVLVCGSIALDLLGSYNGSFAAYQERYPVNALNISLQLGNLRQSFGGCGMNIIYGLKKLGVDCVPLSAAGTNFYDHYRDHLLELGVNIDYIAVDDDYSQCATAIVLSDDAGNQITGFYAGASPSPKRRLPRDIAGIEKCELAILAPEDAPIMLRQARDLANLGVPIMFDPGQGISEFTREELCELLDLSDYVIANSHEWEIICINAEMSAGDIIADQKQVIVTRSERGVDIFERGGKSESVAGLAPRQIVEVTGSGDAFRSGYAYGLMNGLSPVDCGRLGCLIAIYNIESPQTQRYSFTMDQFRQRYVDLWKEPFPV